MLKNPSTAVHRLHVNVNMSWRCDIIAPIYKSVLGTLLGIECCLVVELMDKPKFSKNPDAGCFFMNQNVCVEHYEQCQPQPCIRVGSLVS